MTWCAGAAQRVAPSEVHRTRAPALARASPCPGASGTPDRVLRTGPIACVFALITVASIIPVVRGAERRSFLFFKSGLEVYLGRWAMLVRTVCTHIRTMFILHGGEHARK